MKILLDSKADVSVTGGRLLGHAARNGHLKTVELLLEYVKKT